MQDVVYAKQKHEVISGKLEVANAYMEHEKSRSLEEEAQDLIQQMMGGGVASQKREPKNESKIESPKVSMPYKSIMIQDKPVKEIAIKVPPPEKKEVPVKLDKPYGQNIRSWRWPNFGYKEPDLSEGEALYKVAISDNKISLKEAVDIGLANSVQMQAARKKIQAAEAKLVEAKRALFPAVQGVFTRGGGKQPTSGDDPAGPYRIFKNVGYLLNVNQPLFYGGELLFTIKQAEENVKSVKAEYEKARNELIHNIRAAFYGVVKAEYNLQYQNELYGRVNDVYKRAKEEHARKLVAEVDFLNVESQYYQVYFQAESAKNDLLSADMVLYQTVNVDLDKRFPVDLRLSFAKIHPSYEQILEAAFQNNADVKIKAFAFESAKYGVEVYKSKKVPHWDLRGSYGMRDEMIWDDFMWTENSDPSFKIRPEWFMVVKGSMPLGPNSVEYEGHKNVYAPSVIAPTNGSEEWADKYTFNLFDKLSDITDEKSAQAALLQAQSDYLKAKNDVALKIRDDFYNLQKSLIQVDVSVSRVRFQKKQNDIQEYLMKLQESPSLNQQGSAPSFVDGLINEAQDKFSFIQAVTDYHIAVSSLSVSIGDPYYFERES